MEGLIRIVITILSLSGDPITPPGETAPLRSDQTFSDAAACQAQWDGHDAEMIREAMRRGWPDGTPREPGEYTVEQSCEPDGKGGAGGAPSLLDDAAAEYIASVFRGHRFGDVRR